MGQKVNPIGLRLGINRTWDSRWFARKEYGNLLLDDLGLRKFLQRRLSQAGLSRIVIERAARMHGPCISSWHHCSILYTECQG